MSRFGDRTISLYASTVLGFLAFTTPHASADAFTAGVFMKDMDAAARVPYLEGVIEGLAYARYEKDNAHIEGDTKTIEGMKCVYNWFYGNTPGVINRIYAAFTRYPSYSPGVIIGNMIRPACGG